MIIKYKMHPSLKTELDFLEALTLYSKFNTISEIKNKIIRNMGTPWYCEFDWEKRMREKFLGQLLDTLNKKETKS